MVTDHLLIRRAAAELDRKLARTRVRDVGVDDAGAVALVFGGRGAADRTLKVLPFAPTPLVWLEAEGTLSLTPEPAWVRAAGRVLRGMQLAFVEARPGDRLLRLVFRARSRFGVPDRYTLVLELVPRFGNVVLLKDGTVLAAAKTFSPTGAGRRIEIGRPYEEPPLGIRKTSPVATPELERAAEGVGPVHVARRNAQIAAVHLLPPAAPGDRGCSTSPSLLDAFAEAARELRHGGGAQGDRRRLSLVRTLQARRASVVSQLAALDAREWEVERRDQLRRSGETIYAYLSQITPGTSRFVPADEPDLAVALDPVLSPKENAARYFKRYRKAVASLAHLEKRRAALQQKAAELEQLLWEVERADAAALEEITEDLRGTHASLAKRRRIAAVELPSGGRVYLGRSPRENTEITFRIAKPNDLWFHARNVPGAHVVLQAAGRKASSDEIATAAQLAAYHSRAKGSAAVDVDYTARKHVRKQRDGAVGTVWYTNAKTIRVNPAQAREPRLFK
jgi:predicted ribosome quality control (RQC) complex YloA/Tae2 family protein